MIKVALIFLALAVACGAMLFANVSSPKSPALHIVFIVTSLAFVIVTVIALIKRASTDTRDSLGYTHAEKAPPAEPRDKRQP